MTYSPFYLLDTEKACVIPVAFDLMNQTEGSIVVVITPLTGIMKDQVKRGQSNMIQFGNTFFNSKTFSSLHKKISFQNYRTGLDDSVHKFLRSLILSVMFSPQPRQRTVLILSTRYVTTSHVLEPLTEVPP